jgi:hypothetical protein
MAPTMAEREAELAALQSAFDEYIASSRELEEELDAELAKMRKSFIQHCHCRPHRRAQKNCFSIPKSFFVFFGLCFSVFKL